MQRASTSSIRIQILLQGNSWRKPTRNICLSYRILRRNRSLSRRWMTSMRFHTRGLIILLRREGRSSRHIRDPFQPDQQPGMLWGLQLLRLTFHQGRILQTRSHESLLDEARKLTEDKDFKGYIHDVGGPTADFRQPSCEKQLTCGVCKEKQCLFPKPCKNLRADHKDYVRLLRELRALPKVKKSVHPFWHPL